MKRRHARIASGEIRNQRDASMIEWLSAHSSTVSDRWARCAAT